MKAVKYLMSVIIFIFLTSATKPNDNIVKRTKEDNELADRIRMSFRGGNPRMLASCLNQQIELVIDSEKIDFQKISSQQAEQIFKTFFQKNPPLAFQYVYQGASNTDLRYSVGTYRSRNKDFLVYILVKRAEANKYVIDTIQFREG
ncbi:hypothetical protein EMA8858_01942 [Emticicia aquatica]|uniref:DUF4783 domain-containing protein n=1 Tax=Emticicia aquatica TaxID=1681835 RepID=A0ABN8ESA6_9BACT|nr:DUF4783 domain-containing protein [Emticicia aquatica]CAH0995815.1 hypothetical protein EMA8858_01942 [Emticicia aquatica]